MTLDVCSACQQLLELNPGDGSPSVTSFATEAPRRRLLYGCDLCDEQHKSARRFEGREVVRALARLAVRSRGLQN